MENLPPPGIPKPQVPRPDLAVRPDQPAFPAFAGGSAAPQRPADDYIVEEEATELELERERRKQRALAVGVAVAFHALIAGLVGLIVLSKATRQGPEIVAVAEGPGATDRVQPKTIQPQRTKKPTASPNRVSRVLAAETAAPIAAPRIEDIITEDPIDFGNLGQGLGAGLFGDGGFANFLPPSMSARCSHKDRETRLAESGGRPESEEAVQKAIAWLRTQQNADGSFGKSEHVSAMTGLTLLAYLGHCETPDDPEYGESCTKAILWLVETGLKNDGKLTTKGDRHWVYDHGIATYALAEAYSIVKYGKTKFPSIRDVLLQSVPIIIKGQQDAGGWDYNYDKTGRQDLSVAGWQIQALKAAAHTKLDIPGLNEATDRAMDFLRAMQGENGGFGYTEPGDRITLAGAGALCLILGTGDTRDRAARKAVEFIVRSTKHDYAGAGDAQALYGWYYNTQACFQVGGSDWREWNRGFQPELLKHQSPDGSWPQEGQFSGGAGTEPAGADATLYRTALCTLMLEVYYRYLPATDTGKRSVDGGGSLGF
jgi:hypothetical protein